MTRQSDQILRTVAFHVPHISLLLLIVCDEAIIATVDILYVVIQLYADCVGAAGQRSECKGGY